PCEKRSISSTQASGRLRTWPSGSGFGRRRRAPEIQDFASLSNSVSHAGFPNERGKEALALSGAPKAEPANSDTVQTAMPNVIWVSTVALLASPIWKKLPVSRLPRIAIRESMRYPDQRADHHAESLYLSRKPSMSTCGVVPFHVPNKEEEK